MFDKKSVKINGREYVRFGGLCNYSLADTMECGQCFRYEALECRAPFIAEYMTVVGNLVFTVAQRDKGELLFFGVSDEDIEKRLVPYFALDVDYDKIKQDVLLHTDSQFLKDAAEAGGGIRILRQDPWEALFSFIISQNNNIPRIRKIIRAIALEYGENLALATGGCTCPFGREICEENCRACGACYSFPTAAAVCEEPERLLPSHPGFRYKYLTDAAYRVNSGEIDLAKIAAAASYEYTVSELMKIKGVGHKVASCTALFGFGNLEAFPIDVWMQRAIDTYFDGKLDPASLGSFGGVAQQYIFHYIRLLSK